MSQKIFFTPGPAGMYPQFENFLKQALFEDIPAISHRSQQFRNIYQATYENLKALLQIPDDFAVLFTGSATEIWERIIQNCVEKESFHLVNGEFSKKFFQFSQLLQKNAIAQNIAFGEGITAEEVKVSENAELIALTHNETSSGVSMLENELHQVKIANPEKLTVVDMVSSAPYPALDFNLIDAAFFSVQKAFGLPAGLGVWIANTKCLEKAIALEKKGLMTGTYHRLSNLWSNFEKFETPATPNVLGIYLLGKVVGDMLAKGIENLRKETEIKAQLLYSFLNENENFEVFVKNPAFQSQTVIVAQTKQDATVILKKLAEKNLVVGSGYKDYKTTQIRIANFPNVSIAQIEMLINEMKGLPSI